MKDQNFEPYPTDDAPEDEHSILNAIALEEVVFNDVFSRFYHQLSNQNKIVIKDFFPTAQAMSATMIDAVIETIMQRVPMGSDDEGEFVEKVYAAWSNRECYYEMANTDSFHDIRKVIVALRDVVRTAFSVVPKKYLRKVEKIQPTNLKFDGSYNYAPFIPEPPPAFVYQGDRRNS